MQLTVSCTVPFLSILQISYLKQRVCLSPMKNVLSCEFRAMNRSEELATAIPVIRPNQSAVANSVNVNANRVNPKFSS